MSKIRVMPESLSNKIAAGEVIERPASVVKELMENAIDANSTIIKVEIERAGSKLIQVSDNGSGMDADDVMLALEMHGTSKLTDEKDIFNINTMGFRGEALPSIAAISKFSLISRQELDLEGTLLKVHGGKFIETAPTGCASGTTIRVEDLFYNIPARKKFLKSNATEEHHIQEIFIMLALIYPNITFQLIMDKRVIFNSSASSNLNSRLRTFFGKTFANEMLEINYNCEQYHVHGYIAQAGFTKSVRKEQRTFVNNRVVESFAIYRGIRDGYSTISEKGRYSPCVLFLDLPNSEVDINVHPAKKEVRFNHEFAISTVIEEGIKRTLSGINNDIIIEPKRSIERGLFDNGKASLSDVMTNAYNNNHSNSDDDNYQMLPSRPQNVITQDEQDNYSLKFERNTFDNHDELISHQEQVFEDIATDVRSMHIVDNQAVFNKNSTLDSVINDNSIVAKQNDDDFVFANYKTVPSEIIGILNNSYILCQNEHGLILVDQHAAHERVLFEKLLNEYGENSISQPLLLPEVLDLSPTNSALLLKNIKMFNDLGFDIEPMSKNSVMLNAVPMAIKVTNASLLLEDMLANLLEDGNFKTSATLELLASSACKAAVKFHDNISIEGAKLLLNTLRRCKQPSLCPHGRPTIIEISYKELIKKFQRG